MAVTLSPLMPTSATLVSVAVTTVPLRITVSKRICAPQGPIFDDKQAGAKGAKRWGAPHPPMFFVSVASKGLRYCASSLFATHRRGLRSVASKGLRLHKNCAIFDHFLSAERGPPEATESAKDIPGR